MYFELDTLYCSPYVFTDTPKVIYLKETPIVFYEKVARRSLNQTPKVSPIFGTRMCGFFQGITRNLCSLRDSVSEEFVILFSE